MQNYIRFLDEILGANLRIVYDVYFSKLATTNLAKKTCQFV